VELRPLLGRPRNGPPPQERRPAHEPEEEKAREPASLRECVAIPPTTVPERAGRSILGGGLSFKQLAIKSLRESRADDLLGTAAKLSFYFFLALFPFLVFLTTVVAFLPSLREAILGLLTRIMPSEATRLVRETLHDAETKRGSGLLSFGLLTTLWAASNGVAALIESLNRAYEVKERRSFWRLQLIALGLTIVLSILITGGAALIMFGDRLGLWLSAGLHFAKPVRIAWSAIDYLIGLALLVSGLEVAYHFGPAYHFDPSIRRTWRWITPGTIFAAVAAVIVSLLFSTYLRFAPSYSFIYGSLGAVTVLMLWLYLIGVAILFGAEINSEIAKACLESYRKRSGSSGSESPTGTGSRRARGFPG
jgi:membrane protein